MVDLVGSAAWTGGEEYGGEHAVRIARFLSVINLEALRAYASTLHEHRPCSVSDKFSVGNFNLVRTIRFDDGMEWVARLRMPPFLDGETTTDPASVDEYGRSVILEMQSELATMEFVRQNTDIPIPKIYGYDLNGRNAIGCPFTLIEYIHGNTAEEVGRSYSGDHEGIPPEFEEKFWRQIAQTMIQLASIRLPKIGSIIRDEVNPSKFVVGPLIETNSGPYESAAEFYADYPLALGRKLSGGDQQAATGQEELLEAFRSLATSFHHPVAEGHGTEGFGLANYDLNPNNFLVDREFNVLAVIDWDSVIDGDSVIAVPDAALYRMPFLMGIACQVPGTVETHPAVVRRYLFGRRFAEVVEEVGQMEREKSIVQGTKPPAFLFTKTGSSLRRRLPSVPWSM